MAQDPERLGRFRREAKALAQLASRELAGDRLNCRSLLSCRKEQIMSKAIVRWGK
jgi:hypothetical protein